MCEKLTLSCTDITGATQVNVFHLKYEWKIFNFSLADKTTGYDLRSATFSPAEDVNIMWCLKIYPGADKEESKDWISVFLELVPESRKSVNAKFDIHMVGEQGNIIKSYKNTQYHFTKEEYDWGFTKFISKCDFLNNAHFMPNDCLTIVCYITGNLNITTQSNKLRDNFMNIEIPMSNPYLQSGYETLFKNQELTDVILNASGKALNAHKAILAAHSPVFLAMFNKNMKEKLTNEVDIPDVPYHILQELLRFIYCGSIENMEDFAYDLLIVSDKYAIEPLKLECEKYLSQNLKIDNIIDVISLSDMYNAPNLRKYAIEFFLKYKSEISDTENFKSFGNLQPHTVEEISRRLIKNL